MVTTFHPYLTLKLFTDASTYGRHFTSNFAEGFVFNDANTPADLLQRISSQHFVVYREKSLKINFHPAFIQATGRNGVFVNNILVSMNQKRILRSGDYIQIKPDRSLFQFIDDREFSTKGIPGRILFKYHVDSFIGSGGQSSVRLAHEIATGEKFAMKIIAKSKFEEESTFSYKKRLQHMHDEVRIMQQLRHINIVKFIESFESHSELFILMEFADRDLCVHLQQQPRRYLVESEAKFCLFQICKGLAHIHEQGIAHRDLKVENIFVKHRDVYRYNEPIFKIADFGYSKREDQHLMTQLGTPCYCPPEIQDYNGEYHISADIWTLGCIFYGVLSGSFPFDESYGSSVREQIRDVRLQWMQPQWKHVSSTGMTFKVFNKFVLRSRHVAPN